MALLASGVEPPPPLLTVQPVKGGLSLKWTAGGAERQLTRVFERPGTGEAEEESEEAQESEVSSGTVEVGVPASTTRPRIVGEAREGQPLSVTNGAWSGEPAAYEYSWQRCLGGACVSIPGATVATYLPTSQDAGSYLQVIVSARSATEATGTAISTPSQLVKTEEEGRRSKPKALSCGRANTRGR